MFSVYSRGQNRENFLACGGLLVQKTLFSVYSRGRIRKKNLACGGLFVFGVKIEAVDGFPAFVKTPGVAHTMSLRTDHFPNS